MRTNVLVSKMREHRAVLYTANGCVTQTRLRVCLVHNSLAFANQQGLYKCVNVISIFHGKGPFLTPLILLSFPILPLLVVSEQVEPASAVHLDKPEASVCS